jgi:holo-[acyl-carrier protein] synthase
MNQEPITSDLVLDFAGARGMRLGIDVVQVSRVGESLASFGERFMQRLFTSDELAYATSVEALTVERLAARFAAKEAALKAFDWCESGIDWREIEVQRQHGGACRLALHGKAAAMAGIDAAGIALSLSHDGDYAMAVVTAPARDPSSSGLPATP